MKFSKFIVLLSAALAAVVAAVSCQKEEGSASVPEPAGKVEICITGDFNDFDGLDTKASIENIFRMTWAANDKVYVYGKESGASGPSGESLFICLGTLTATPDESTGNRVADLAGTITAPKENTKLTLVYSPILTSSPAVTDGAISIDLSSQSGKASDVTFVAYTAVDYKGTAGATYRTSFSFATSVLRVNVSGLAASTALTNATLGAIETECKLTFAEAAAPTIEGATSGTISRTLTDCSANAKGTAAFYIAVPAITANDSRELIVLQQGEKKDYGLIGFATGSKAAGSMMNSIAPVEPLHGVLNGQEYVKIGAKYDGTNYSYLKWATQNLAVTTSGKAKWKDTDYQIGDYFQWAASYAGYGITAEADKVPTNLVIYDSFVNTFTTSGNSFTFKGSKTFAVASAPYYNDAEASYSKYNSTDSKTVLESSDDVASIVLGGTWRMPTGGSAGNFTKMRAVTYWAWDATDIGYYVFWPGVGTSGSAGGIGTLGQNDDKTKSLLFFPAAGDGDGTSLYDAGSNGLYWSGTLYSDFTDSAYDLLFNSSDVYPEDLYYRYYGFSVRPVSD